MSKSYYKNLIFKKAKCYFKKRQLYQVQGDAIIRSTFYFFINSFPFFHIIAFASCYKASWLAVIFERI